SDLLHRPLAHGEDHAVALGEAHHLGARLHARPLFGQHELTALKVASGLGEEDRDLQRKEMLAVHVLVQTIVVAQSIAQKKRRRPHLARLMAAGAKRLVPGGIANGNPHRLIPPVGYGCKPRIEAAAKRDDQLRQRLDEVLVLATAKAMARHHDARAEAGVVRVERLKLATRLGRDEPRRDRASVGVEVALNSPPVERVERRCAALIRPTASAAFSQREKGGGSAIWPLSLWERSWDEGPDHHAASRAISSRLRSIPQR